MQPQSRSQRIAAELRDEILRGQYRRGERLPSERDLADRFGVHRGSVREALKKLEQLGLTDIRPGGARVAPIEEASLDVVPHLLALGDPPDPEVVGQVMEVLSGLFAMSARLGVERASDEQRQAMLAVLDALASPDLAREEHLELFHGLGDLFIEASGNLVLKLVRRGVRTQVAEHLEARVGARVPKTPPPDSLRLPPLQRLAKAVENADGNEASAAVLEFTTAMHQHALAAMRARLQEDPS